MDSPTCETCRFWEPPHDNRQMFIDDYDPGKCRKYAPRNGFPVSFYDDWCGEHQTKQEGEGWENE